VRWVRHRAADVVSEAKHLLLIRVVPLHSDFHDDALFFADRVKYVVMQHVLLRLMNSTKPLTPPEKRSFPLARELVYQAYLDAVVEKDSSRRRFARMS